MISRTFIFFVLFGWAGSFCANGQKVDMMIVGTDHLAQLYKKDQPNTDIFLSRQQKEIKAFTDLLTPYKPDLILVEVLPEEQAKIDSLYALYVADQLKLEALEDGRSEVYQLAFRMARALGLPKIYGVNAPGGTSQSILDNGENIQLYKDEGRALRTMVTEKIKALQENKLSWKDYLIFINQHTTYQQVYRLRYLTPLRVMNGTFNNPDAMVDTAFINPKYIGAELTSIFKNRDYKIYSNIVTTQLKTKARRALLIIGAAHIGSLKSIFRDDEDYNLVDPNSFFRK